MAEATEQTSFTLPPPSPALRALDRLVGKWEVKGRTVDTDEDYSGTYSAEWMEGGYFLLQRSDIGGIKGMEVTGYDSRRQMIISYFFESTGGAYIYRYELQGDELAITGLEVIRGLSSLTFDDLPEGSTVTYRGTFGDDGKTLVGSWRWPDGGYDAVQTRID